MGLSLREADLVITVKRDRGPPAGLNIFELYHGLVWSQWVVSLFGGDLILSVVCVHCALGTIARFDPVDCRAGHALPLVGVRP